MPRGFARRARRRMSWIVATWAMLASACLTLAFTYAVIGAKQPFLRSHLLFAGAAVSVAAVALFELTLMRAHSIEEYARMHRWGHVAVFATFVFMVFFVREYLCAGRWWLACLVCGIRLLGIVVNFSSGASLSFQEITALRQITFMGEGVSVARGTLNAWAWLGPLGSFTYVVYAVDASLAAWRSGSPIARRRAITVGGSTIFFVVAATLHANLVHAGLIESPYLITATFFSILAVMAYALATDVARSVELSKELGRSERRMQLAVEAAGIGLWEWDIVNDRIHLIHGDRVFGGTRQPANLAAFLARVHAEDRDAVERAIRESLDTGIDCVLEFRIHAPAPGAPRWVGSRGRVERGPSGKAVLMRGVVFDITQRRLAQDRVRMVLNAAPNGFLMMDPRGDIVMANAQAESIFGYAPGELLHRSVDTLVPEAQRRSYQLYRQHYFSSTGPHARSAPRELAGLRKDGSEVAIQIGFTPLESTEGRFVVAAIVDVTERRQLKREMAQRTDELVHLSRVAVLGELSGSLTHELKQPLAAILANAQAAEGFMSRGGAGLAEVRRALADIVHETKRAFDLIERLWDLFRRGERERKPVDMNHTIMEVLRILHSELDQHGVAVAVRLAPQLPAVTGDGIQLQQVLLNLIVNAIDAMHAIAADERRLVVQTARIDADHIQVWITDSGTGIAVPDLQRIFEPFVTHKKQGLGLGLMVCQAIVEAHGGVISAENNVDGGAIFRVTLPVMRDDALSAGP
jgi:two-component system, LuxR family, sensor kinase FixL